jgi:hypothetical protein
MQKIIKLILVILFIWHTPVFSQLNPRIGPRIFNRTLSYGPRNNNTLYSVGYSFTAKNTIASIEAGFKPISVGMYIVQSEPFTLNSRPINYFYMANYVYQYKNSSNLLITGGAGTSINGNNNGIVAKFGADLKITTPVYLSLHTFQVFGDEMKNYSTIGLKVYFF